MLNQIHSLTLPQIQRQKNILREKRSDLIQINDADYQIKEHKKVSIRKSQRNNYLERQTTFSNDKLKHGSAPLTKGVRKLLIFGKNYNNNFLPKLSKELKKTHNLESVNKIFPDNIIKCFKKLFLLKK